MRRFPTMSNAELKRHVEKPVGYETPELLAEMRAELQRRAETGQKSFGFPVHRRRSDWEIPDVLDDQ